MLRGNRHRQTNGHSCGADEIHLFDCPCQLVWRPVHCPKRSGQHRWDSGSCERRRPDAALFVRVLFWCWSPSPCSLYQQNDADLRCAAVRARKPHDVRRNELQPPRCADEPLDAELHFCQPTRHGDHQDSSHESRGQRVCAGWCCCCNHLAGLRLCAQQVCCMPRRRQRWLSGLQRYCSAVHQHIDGRVRAAGGDEPDPAPDILGVLPRRHYLWAVADALRYRWHGRLHSAG